MPGPPIFFLISSSQCNRAPWADIMLLLTDTLNLINLYILLNLKTKREPCITVLSDHRVDTQFVNYHSQGFKLLLSEHSV